MFRISTEPTDDGLRLKLEGRLIGPWVAEADSSWREIRATPGEPSIVVDLCGLSAVDDAGRGLLVRMHRAGVRFAVRGCVMRELIREIAEEVSRTTVLSARGA
jgi:anti-anti-sigma regulatory factor